MTSSDGAGKQYPSVDISGRCIYIYVLGFVFRKYIQNLMPFFEWFRLCGTFTSEITELRDGSGHWRFLVHIARRPSKQAWLTQLTQLWPTVKFGRGVSLQRQAMPGFRWERKRSTRGAERETEIHVSQLKFPKKTSQKKHPKNYPKLSQNSTLLMPTTGAWKLSTRPIQRQFPSLEAIRSFTSAPRL
jgi:hypothetical protein